MTDLHRAAKDSHEAAAFWGTAQGGAYPLADSFALAMLALNYFGGEYEKREEELEKKFTTSVLLSIPFGDYNPTIAGIDEEEAAALCEEANVGDDMDYHFTIVELSV